MDYLSRAVRYRVGMESVGLFQHLSLAFEIDLDIMLVVSIET